MPEPTPAATESQRACAACGTTLEHFARTGLLGCARCYVVFAREVEAAVEAVHGVPAPPEPNPWPTRGAVRARSAPVAPDRGRDVH